MRTFATVIPNGGYADKVAVRFEISNGRLQNNSGEPYSIIGVF